MKIYLFILLIFVQFSLFSSEKGIPSFQEILGKENILPLPENISESNVNKLIELYRNYDAYNAQDNKNTVTSELFTRIEKNPLDLAGKIKQSIPDASELFDYCLFNYIKKNSKFFKNCLHEISLEEAIKFRFFDHNNAWIEVQGADGGTQTCRKNFGLVWGSITPRVVLYNLKNHTFVSAQLHPFRINSNISMPIIWGERRDSCGSSTGTLSIFEWKDDKFNEFYDGPFKEILKKTIIFKDKDFFEKSILEDIITSELYITVNIEIGRQENFLEIRRTVNEEIFPIKLLYRYPKSNYSIKNDLQRFYIVEWDKKFALLFYDYDKQGFCIIQSNIDWNLVKNVYFFEPSKEFQNNWMYFYNSQQGEIKDDYLFFNTDKNSVTIKIKPVKIENILSNVPLFIYQEDMSEEPIIQPQEKLKEQPKIFNITELISLDLDNEHKHLGINYKDEEYIFNYNIFNTEIEALLQKIRGSFKQIKSYIDVINEEWCYLRIISNKRQPYYGLNFIFSRKELMEAFLKKIEKVLEKRISYQLILEAELSKKQKRKEKIIKWTLGILGVSAAAALLWSWWKKRAKSAE